MHHSKNKNKKGVTVDSKCSVVYVSLWLSLLECALFFLSTAAANERCIGAMFDEGKYESKLKG